MLAAAEEGVRIAAVAGEVASGGMEQAFQKAGAPCVPEFGIGAADVGNGQKVECAEAFVGLHAFAEGIEYVRVLDVFFLGDGGHEQVVFDQPGEQVAFFFGQEVVGGKLARVRDALYGMVAAASFGDVVEEGGEIRMSCFQRTASARRRKAARGCACLGQGGGHCGRRRGCGRPQDRCGTSRVGAGRRFFPTRAGSGPTRRRG